MGVHETALPLPLTMHDIQTTLMEHIWSYLIGIMRNDIFECDPLRNVENCVMSLQGGTALLPHSPALVRLEHPNTSSS
jgi:hypothetical protein